MHLFALHRPDVNVDPGWHDEHECAPSVAHALPVTGAPETQRHWLAWQASPAGWKPSWQSRHLVAPLTAHAAVPDSAALPLAQEHVLGEQVLPVAW